ncbi:hypothetical protein K402DRAFT_390508 [Aulographum hederae CBS 113979]|uniref:SGNH hydrolase n=1 Tax=Aulographum hederae CBS 113979 TaxID=1176131 RepID=A0A6G1H8Q8_9PEZI|nr:hypothetical protein K402DRAFT_390508 [Aulographum hederae CBS 113979]
MFFAGFLCCLFCLFLVRVSNGGKCTTLSLPNAFSGLQKTFNSSVGTQVPFEAPEDVPYRRPDAVDTFADYKYRAACNISSQELHAPFSPLCQDRQSVLTAMSSGGRIGKDAPFMPRGCDMRWFNTAEVCEILSRFDRVIITGDSMMRHLIGSLNVLIRQDLGYGAVTDWNFSPDERKECFCNNQFNVKGCSVQGIYKTADVMEHDPMSVACDAGTINVAIEEIIRFPIPPDEIERFKTSLPSTKPNRPVAFVMGHGLWNDLDLQASVNWLDKLMETTTIKMPWLNEPGAFFPRLMLTPNAAGIGKPTEWRALQGNEALMEFEESVKVEAAKRGVEHLGTWNMSAQASKYDGTHLDLRGNLVKGMMVMNWLNMLDVERY